MLRHQTAQHGRPKVRDTNHIWSHQERSNLYFGGNGFSTLHSTTRTCHDVGAAQERRRTEDDNGVCFSLMDNNNSLACDVEQGDMAKQSTNHIVDEENNTDTIVLHNDPHESSDCSEKHSSNISSLNDIQNTEVPSSKLCIGDENEHLKTDISDNDSCTQYKA